MSTEQAIVIAPGGHGHHDRHPDHHHDHHRDHHHDRHRDHHPDRQRPPAVPFSRLSGRNSAITLPKWIYIKDRNGRYLTQLSGQDTSYYNITFRTGSPTLDCAFEAVPYGTSAYRLVARNGNPIVRYYTSWYSTLSGYTNAFDVITAKGNKVYLKDYSLPSLFFSDELNENGAPKAHDYINDSSEMEIVQAAVKNEIVDVQYEINSAAVRDVAPLIALNTAVRNDSDGEVSQTLSYEYEKWTVGTWNNTAGTEIGTTATFSAGVPFVTSAEFEISISASYSHEWGGEEGVRQNVTSSTTVVVPPKKKARATIIVRNAQIDVPFTYTQRVLWSNGASEDSKKIGIYQNVDSWHVDVQLDNWEDI